MSCCKCIFNQIKANFAEIQPENHQNVQKTTYFWQKVPGVNGLKAIPELEIIPANTVVKATNLTAKIWQKTSKFLTMFEIALECIIKWTPSMKWAPAEVPKFSSYSYCKIHVNLHSGDTSVKQLQAPILHVCHFLGQKLH